MIIKLNQYTTLEFCDKKSEGALNAFDFEANDDWVIKRDSGERFEPRYTYNTTYANKKGLYFSCGSAKVAIQQAIIDSINSVNSKQSLKDIYFKVKHYKQEIPEIKSHFENEEEKHDFNIWLEHYHIKGKGIDVQAKKTRKRNKKYIIINTKGCIHLYLGTKEFDEWIDERIKEFKALK